MSLLREINGYQVIKEIGRGATGVVYLARNPGTPQDVCIKCITKISLPTAKEKIMFHHEVEVLSTLKHERIVEYYDLMEDTENYYLFMEYCQGDNLQTLISRTGSLRSPSIQKIFSQFLDALAYIHSRGVAHRDIKPDNIIVDGNYNIKVVDFGLCTNDTSCLRTTFCGSLVYAAPECISRQPYLADRADIWSAGVLMYILAVGKLPWKTSSIPQIIRQITTGNFTVPQGVLPTVVYFISSMMRLEPELRPTAAELLKNPFFSPHSLLKSTYLGKLGMSRSISSCPILDLNNCKGEQQRQGITTARPMTKRRIVRQQSHPVIQMPREPKINSARAPRKRPRSASVDCEEIESPHMNFKPSILVLEE